MFDKQNYELAFCDDFDRPTLDTSKWLALYFPHAAPFLNRSVPTYYIWDSILHLQIDEMTPCYSDEEPMKVSSIQTVEKNGLHPGTGKDNITKIPPFEGFAIKYGYFEMRAKLPQCGGGGHMAWWLVGTQDDAADHWQDSVQTGEIDIVETLFSRNKIFSPSVHEWNDPKLKKFHVEIPMEDFDDTQYHVYGLDWTAQGLKFYIDGKCLAETGDSPDYRMGMLLGVYTDTNWSGEDNGVYPKCLCVDYVKVYRLRE